MLKKCIGVFTLCFLFVLPNNSYARSPENRFLDQFFERYGQLFSREECQDIIKEFKEVSANSEELDDEEGLLYKAMTLYVSMVTLFLLPCNGGSKSPEDRFLDQFFERCEQFLSDEECQNIREGCQDIIREFKEASSNTRKLNVVISSISKICKKREGVMYGYHSFMDCEKKASAEIEKAKYLIENGADIDTINAQNKSMLSVAAEANSPALTQWLIDYGANIELVDGRGMTALFTAIAHNSPEVLKVLLQNKSNTVLTESEKSALFFTYQLGYKKIAELLSEHT